MGTTNPTVSLFVQDLINLGADPVEVVPPAEIAPFVADGEPVIYTVAEWTQVIDE